MTILLRRDKGYKGKIRRPGEARRQSIVFASRKPQRNGIRRIPILKLRLAVELLNKETHHRDVMSFFLLNPGPPFIENSSNFLLYRLADSNDNPLSRFRQSTAGGKWLPLCGNIGRIKGCCLLLKIFLIPRANLKTVFLVICSYCQPVIAWLINILYTNVNLYNFKRRQL